MIGLSQSPSPMPTARSMRRAGAASTPSVTVRLRGFGSMAIAVPRTGSSADWFRDPDPAPGSDGRRGRPVVARADGARTALPKDPVCAAPFRFGTRPIPQYGDRGVPGSEYEVVTCTAPAGKVLLHRTQRADRGAKAEGLARYGKGEGKHQSPRWRG